MIKKRVEGLIASLEKNNLDGLFLTNETNVRYMTGFTGGESFAIISKGVQALITDSRYTEWANGECKGFDIIEYRSSKQSLYDVVAQTCLRHGIKKLGFEKKFMMVNMFETFQEKLGTVEFVGTQGLVETLRAVKDEDEIDCLRKAASFMDTAFAELLNHIESGVTEKELNCELEYLVKKSGADDIGFPFIVAAGARGSMPHSIPSDRPVQEGEFITFDIGANYHGYRSDMTRTIAVDHVSDRQAEIYNIVKSSNEQAELLLKAGVENKLPHLKAVEVIQEAGIKEGVFQYAVGHGIGLDIHEEPSLSAISQAVLKAGNVVTIEPGIYIPGWGGVRVEDSLVITEDGYEQITMTSKELIIV